jgi:hypothetical protein
MNKELNNNNNNNNIPFIFQEEFIYVQILSM